MMIGSRQRQNYKHSLGDADKDWEMRGNYSSKRLGVECGPRTTKLISTISDV